MPPFDYNDATLTLQELRKTGQRKPDVVVSLGDKLINNKNYFNKLGDEAWSVLEQVLISSLDVGKEELTKSCLEKLETRFPESPRVKILQAMKLESEDKLNEALSIYEDILKDDDANIIALKRRISVYKAKGQDQQAMEYLTQYLDAYYNDAEAWLELTSLYLNYHLYQQASYCLEELILLQPQNYFFHLKYAEVLYSNDNLIDSLKGFCRVLELCGGYENNDYPENIRALFGIKLNNNTSNNSSIINQWLKD
ncbi:21403_t:CDS:2 [Entrophospora sp. SA101]|nr:21403_t:CDS:2 [Entrophospora sp. SA101]